MYKRIQVGGHRYNSLVYWTLVDLEDYEILNQRKWSAHPDHSGNIRVRGRNSLGKKTYMHREIMGVAADTYDYDVDHKNGDTLDNRRSNLRVVTFQENASNRRGASRTNESSGLRGVYWHVHVGKWTAKVCIDYKQIHLGYFDDMEEAARVVEAYRLKHMPGSLS